MEQRINGRTGLLCLIGSPVGHSGSPRMYNDYFRRNGQDLVYMAFDIKEDQVPEFIRAARLLNIRGFNATMPCKQAVAACVDELSPAAKIVGACNTVVNDNGRFIGHITDGVGFVRNMKEHGVEVDGADIVLTGAGGAGTAVMVECAFKGAASLTVYNRGERGLEKAVEVAQRLKEEGVRTRLEVVPLSEKERYVSDIRRSDIFINTTSLGMAPHEDTTPIEDVSAFHPGLVVADAVYNPVMTRLLREAGAAGVRQTITGEGMLKWQGDAAYQLYTGLPAS